MSKLNLKGALLATTVITGMAIAAPAYAQSAPSDGSAATAPATADKPADQAVAPNTSVAAGTQTASSGSNGAGGGDIIITGSILRTKSETASPVTTLTSQSLDARGISTTQSAIQQLASNNGPALYNSFTANGAFAGGASAVSLRGLSTNSTLVLFDGQRSAYYPLADDGARNFVDLNTIPDDIVERVEVLRDGASSSYGADAIAGVVNVITRREFKGLRARADYGISQHGQAPEYRLSLTAGQGDLGANGYNAYISGFWYKSTLVRSADLPGPYNTSDQQSICFHGTCGGQGIFNGLQNDGVLSPFTPNGLGFTFRRLNPDNGTNGIPIGAGTGKYSDASCGNLPTHVLTAEDIANNSAAIQQRLSVGQVVCQTDFQKLFGVINPNIDRWGISGRVTTELSGGSEAYAEINFLDSKVSFSGFGYRLNRNLPAPVDNPLFSLSNANGFAPGSFPLSLPVFVCPGGIGAANGITGCDANSPGAVLNKDNPYASEGLRALVAGGFPQLVPHTSTAERSYRGAFGVKGQVLDNWDYDVEAVLSHVDLNVHDTGYVEVQDLLDAIARGEISLSNPLSNTKEQLQRVAPDHDVAAKSDLYSLSGTASRALAQLPGGPLQLGLGVQARYESVDDPSGNPDENGASNRFLILNAFGAVGHRNVYSGFAELDAPILPELTVNASGRYDKYSTGPSSFSPKLGVKFTPIHQIALRGTYSRGFRIPSFGEANAFPTTGFVNATPGLYGPAYLAQYGCTPANIATCSPNYLNNAPVGLTTLSNTSLKPEKARSFTAGVILEPLRSVSFTVDYYNIQKTQAISNPDFSAAERAYYDCASLAAFNAGQCNVPGFKVIPDVPDVNHPNALPRIQFIQGTYVNANTIKSSGLDFGVNIRQRFGAVKWTSILDSTYIINLSTTFPDGTTQHYAGTLGNFNLTSGSGTPRWRATWQNSFEYGPVILTGTVNYFGGYNLSAEDQGGKAGDCGLDSGIQACNVKAYPTFDLNVQYKLLDRYTLYGTALNVFNTRPPLDTVTYGAYLYNPVQGGDYGIFGRFFKVGIKAEF